MTFSRGLMIVMLLATGCSRDVRFDLSGEVTHAGQPVHEGHIMFEPLEPGAGGGFARINQGKYDTRHEGRNHPGGKHKVTISAYKGLKNPKNPDSDVLLAFPAYETEAELPRRSTTMSFDVPREWGQKTAAAAAQR